MGRKKSKFWEHVERLEDNRFKCKFCEKEFAGGASRITAHLAGEKGDIVSCGEVPKDVKKRAYEEIPIRNKKRKIVPPSSSNVEENGTILSQSVQEGAHIPSDYPLTADCPVDGEQVTRHNSHSSSGDVLPTTAQAGQTTDIRNIEEEINDMNESLCSVGCTVDGERVTHHNNHLSNGDVLPTTALAGQTIDVGNMEEDPSMVTSDANIAFPGSFGCPPVGEQVTHLQSSNEYVRATTAVAGQTTNIGNVEGAPSGNAMINLEKFLLSDSYPLDFEQVTNHNSQSSNEDIMPTTALAGQTTDVRNTDEDPTMVTSNPNIAISGSFGCPPVGEQVIHHNSHSNNGEVLPTPALAGQTADVRNTEDDPSTVIDEVENRGYPLLTTKLVGQASQRNVDEIWKILMKDNVLSIGIHGMGGVGKTALVIHIHNRLLEKQSSDVFWVTVSQDFSIKKLQNDIAKVIKLDLSDEDDVKKRAAKLAQNLKRKKKLLVLILDDVWKYFSLQEVGIPVEVNGCKLILTTRFLDMCQRMCCQENVKLEPLNEEEVWNLFVEKFGHDIPLGVEGIARSIAKECAGLPLGIITVAGSMKGVGIDIHGWRNTLEELNHSKAGLDDMEDEVFGVLKFSYNILKEDPKLQQCFLYCSLYPEDFKIERDDLIKNLIDEGIIQGMKSRQDEFDKGHVMLNKLENAYLLGVEDFYGNKCVKMHDLVRDMAIQIAQARHGFMVEAGKRLEDLPDEEKWKEDLVRVSLMYNGLTKIPSNALRGCPKLSTLMLNNNYYLETIPDDFFVQMLGLKVLNLSYTNIEYLPDSIFNLKNLTALVLIKCEKLKHVNSLEKLTALRRLELVHTGIKEIPQGMEMLVNLRHLHLYSKTLKIFPSGILPKFSQLRHFEILLLWNYWSSTISWNLNLEAEEVESLKKLETFKCQFNDIHAFNTCVKSLEKVRPTNYVLILASKAECGRKEGKEVILKDCSIITEKDALLLPKDVQFLKLCDIGDLRSLCDLLSSIPLLESIEVLELESLKSPSLLAAPSRPPFGTFSRLKVFRISDCYIIKLFAPRLLQYLHNLEEIIIEHCSELEEIIGELSDEEEDGELSDEKEDIISSSPVPPGTFSRLKKFDICNCPIKKLFLPGLLQYLHNLEEIYIGYCSKLEEIIGELSDEEEDDERNKEEAIDISLPKLRLLEIEYLPSLKSICSSSQLMVCDSIQKIKILFCSNLNRLPLSLPLHNGQLCPPPSLYKIEAGEKRWESLEWDDPNSKAVLQSFVEYNSYDQETSDDDSYTGSGD